MRLSGVPFAIFASPRLLFRVYVCLQLCMQTSATGVDGWSYWDITHITGLGERGCLKDSRPCQCKSKSLIPRYKILFYVSIIWRIASRAIL